MTARADPPELARRRRLQALHAEARRIGMDEAARRALLERVTGRRSAADCNLAQLEAALDELRRLGGGRSPLAREPQQRLVWKLWQDAAACGAVQDGSQRALDQFVERMTGIARLAWARAPADLNPVVEALKAMIARRRGEAA